MDGKDAWATPGDFWVLVQQARYVASGALGYVYEVRQYPLPLFVILLAPAVALGDALGLVQNLPFGVRRPSMWVLLAPYCLALCVPVVAAVGRLAERLRPDRSPAGLQCAVAGALIPVWYFGHYEDALALGAVVAGLNARLSDNDDRSALWLGVAIAFKQWAVFVAPVLILTAGRPRRAALLAAALPGLLAAFLLSVDFKNASEALLRTPTTIGTRFGHLHPLGFGDLYVTTLPARLVGLTLVALVGLEAARRRLRRGDLVVAVGFSALVRAAVEPVLYAYYLTPAVVFALLDAHERRRPLRGPVAAATLMLGWHYFRPRRLIWWPVELLLAAILFRGLVARSMKLYQLAPKTPGSPEQSFSA